MHIRASRSWIRVLELDIVFLLVWEERTVRPVESATTTARFSARPSPSLSRRLFFSLSFLKFDLTFIVLRIAVHKCDWVIVCSVWLRGCARRTRDKCGKIAALYTFAVNSANIRYGLRKRTKQSSRRH